MMKLQAIPKFANNLREKLGDSVRLTGPSGATWNVGLTLIRDTLFLKHGWKEFISCEKEASCFVKKCRHADVASGSRTKRHTPIEYSSRDVSEAPPTKKPKLAATPTSEDTSKSSSHDEYEPPTKKKTLASTSTSADTNESSLHNEYEPPSKRQLSLHRLQHLEHGVLELMPSCRPKEIKCYVWTELDHARNHNGVSKLLQKMGR
ncbi:hypothetical protein CQW23_32319 [Capsicum baccatum]|uniref:TF-B3 domain-containing protein n=1 Tax=Capsicum baccatum TaxID=33114 RepID=A0A2G2V507_CAPBA|nr:hypothetical protein CQW23_32319 [Capsicum baccatum]